MTFKAVLFDFEGTLVDFQWKLEEGEAALRAAFARLGFPADQLHDLSYSGLWNLAADHPRSAVGLDELRRRVGPVYDEYDLDALTRWQLRGGATYLLAAARVLGQRTAIVSNIGRLALLRAVARFQLTDAFDRVLSRDDVRLMKPAPEGIRECLSDWDLTPAEVLFVGDSLTDVRAARAAGVRVVIVAGGESSAEALREEPPDHYGASLEDVAGLLG